MLEPRVVRKNIQKSKREQKRVFPESARTLTRQTPKRNFIGVSVLTASTAWTVWLTVVGPKYAIENLIVHWQAAVTMVFGSIVAGGTSMGGGAIAFPVFTKVLHVSPHDAKVFSLAIQSVGMSAASLVIVAMKTRLEWRFIRWASLGGIPGIFLGSVFFSSVLFPDLIRLSFTMMVGSFGIVLYVLNRSADKVRNLAIPFWGNRERAFSLLAGLWGGTISGLVGSGMDIVCFSVLVLLFGMCEKVSTPTSVVLMAFNAIVGFTLHQYVLNDVEYLVTSYWLAAVPVVVVGAPAGAILCDSMGREAIVKVLMCLVLLEVSSSFLLIPLSPTLLGYSLMIFLFFSFIYYWMHKFKIYELSPNLVRAKP